MPTFLLHGQAPYQIRQPDRIPTPRLIIFKDRVADNLRRMRSYLEEIAPASGFQHLCPHIKTNKSSLVTRMLVNAGIRSLKTTMREVDIAIAAGAAEIFIAYPLLAHDAERLAVLIRQNPQIEFLVQIGSLAHAEILRRIGAATNVAWQYLIDLDVGMHRTGVAPAAALHLYQELSGWHDFQFLGLHGYNGHIHHPSASERLQHTQRAMGLLLEVTSAFQQIGVNVARVIVAGSQTFRFDLNILLEALPPPTHVQVSPGTWVYWDSGYDALAPGEFDIAALILTQVIEVGDENRITLNLGHKRWAADQGPVNLFSCAGMEVVKFSEEHTVIAHPASMRFSVGDYVLIAPKHVCPTVNLYEEFTLINAEGEIENTAVPVDGRNR